MQADLDGDMQVAAVELAALLSVSTRGVRGRLALAFRAADANVDGLVDPGELHAHAGRIAMQELSERDETELFDLLVLDRDKDGLIELEDAAVAIAALTIDS